MKNFQKRFVSGGFPWLILAVIWYASVFIFSHYENSQATPEIMTREFQSSIQSVGTKAKSRVESFRLNFDTSGKWQLYPGVDNHEVIGNEEIFLFVYKNDSLVFWNNNSVVLPESFPKRIADENFVMRLKNGWYGFYGKKSASFLFLGCYRIKNEFPFQNDFLRNSYAEPFDLPPTVIPDSTKGSHAVYADDGIFLVSLTFPDEQELIESSGNILFILLILGCLSLFYALFLFYSDIPWLKARGNLLALLYTITLVFLRVIQCYFRFPAEVYNSGIFSPAYYSSSTVLPSLGDFILNVIILLAISLVFYRSSTFSVKQGHKPTVPFVRRYFLILFLLLFLFHTMDYLIRDLIMNSAIPLNLQNISGLTGESIVGLFIITSMLISYWLIFIRFLKTLTPVPSIRNQVTAMLLIIGLTTVLYFILKRDTIIYPTLFFLILYFLYRYAQMRGNPWFSIQNIIVFLTFFAVFATYILNDSYHKKETEQINLLALKLVRQQNPVTEILFEQLERRMLEDTILRFRINAWDATGMNGGDSLSNYITTHFFQDYWKKYHIQVTLCDPDKNLKIQPQGFLMNCTAYFQGLIATYGKTTAMPNLHFLDYGFGKEFYLAAIHLPVQGEQTGREQTVFIELSLKNSYPDPGYPGLLMDNSRIEITALPDYSYGFYKNGWLVRAFGAYSYKMELTGYNALKKDQTVFSSDKMRHYQYRINDSDMLLISKKEESLLSLLSPFSYLFILFSVIVLIISGIVAFPKEFRLFPVSLRNRLQLSLIGILVLTMFAVGIIQVMNIVHINSKKNNDNLKEKAYSILVEVQHKYGTFTETRDGRVLGLSDFLVKLSNVFFTDINVYNDHGMLLASSRPQIFEEGLLSERMNAEAVEKLVVEKNSMFIHSESIGSMHFNSAYLPFYNEDDRLIGFINLPYFIKQDEAKKEISSFLVTFINIYILLILLGMFVIVVISNHITAPLAVLASKISKLRLGSVNEKIPWNQKDEIGQLVTEYNRMIDELGRSAEILARSEREGAWRQMARQVAHEIKNPLTPMKLSAQYLEKAWNEKAPDWDQRLARFTKTLVEQIDALSVIATDFSDFAKMPEVEFADVNMEEVVRFVLSMYVDTSPIRFEFHCEPADTVISADRSQMVRMLTNLLNNAVQAISDPTEGIIVVKLNREPGFMVLSVTDNGCGISPDRFERIFQPDFTTKTSGMGLGLAIVKGILDSMHGKISVSSVEQKGTTFVIKLPVNGVPI